MTSVHVFVAETTRNVRIFPNLNVIFGFKVEVKKCFFVELNREHAQIGEELSFVLSLIELYLDKVLRICKRMAEKFIHKNID